MSWVEVLVLRAALAMVQGEQPVPLTCTTAEAGSKLLPMIVSVVGCPATAGLGALVTPLTDGAAGLTKNGVETVAGLPALSVTLAENVADPPGSLELMLTTAVK